MKGSELREMTPDELRRRIKELRDELFKLRLRRGTEELPNPLRLRMIRRDIARCLTVMREKDMASAVDGTEQADG